MKKISNRQAREYVINTIPFQGNNLRGEEKFAGIYVVYSYQMPILICILASGQWYENATKYSVTTSKHASQCRPYEREIKSLPYGEFVLPITRLF